MKSGTIFTGSPDVFINGKKAARRTDLTDHGGMIVTGAPDVLINGTALNAARQSDTEACPATEPDPHVGGPVIGPCSADVFIGNLAAARQGDAVLCTGALTAGDAIAAGLQAQQGAGVPGCAELWAKYQKQAQDLIDPVDGNDRDRNKVISGAYADLYLKDKTLIWAGLAGYASKQVGCAMDHAQKMESLGVFPADLSGAYTYQMLGKGNRALFLDVYPVHLFYLENGYDKLAECAGDRVPPLPAQLLDGFHALQQYKETGDPKYLAQSLESIAMHEQINILQADIYNDYTFHRILKANEMKIGGVALNVDDPISGGKLGTYPASVVMGSSCADPTGGKDTHVFGDEAGHDDLTDVAQRMDWILNDIGADYLTWAGSSKHVSDLQKIKEEGEKTGGKYP